MSLTLRRAPHRRSSRGQQLERHDAGATAAIPRSLVDAARDDTQLCASQQSVRPSGDGTIAMWCRRERGWVATIQGVVASWRRGGRGAAQSMRAAWFFAAPRLSSGALGISRALRRIRGASWRGICAGRFAVWELEDDGRLTAGAGWIALATSIQAMT
jgi:hypothetical protein